MFVGRTSELGRLRAALDGRAPTVVRVTGLRGGGKSALVARVLADYPHLVHTAPPLPDRAQRERLALAIRRCRARHGLAAHEESTAPDWKRTLAGAVDLASPDGRPFALVLDDVHRLAQARARYLEAVLEAVERAAGLQRPLHVVLVGPEHALPTGDRLPPDTPEPLRLGPLPFRAASALLPGSRPIDLLRAYGVFGGVPRVLARLDRDVALGTNVRRLLLAADGALTDAGGEWLERDVQTPSRYYAILAALKGGEADWSTVHRGLPELTRSGQAAPYLKRMEELGLVRSRRSLDAAPSARARRYGLSDPFFAAWARFALSAEPDGGAGTGRDAYAAVLRPALEEQIGRAFPLVCRQYMAHDAMETLGERARIVGSLWGPGYDIPVAGTLEYGSPYYGACLWDPAAATAGVLRLLDRQLRETRYGFGRERRLRVVFTGHQAPRALQREIARRHDATLVDAEALVGGP